ncbi:MAG TPA: hypothetical protein VHG71_11995 [Verrucomicrobiae bacterium]|nr:hypothetical protein [Verrucomicrobiae bacterium]
MKSAKNVRQNNHLAPDSQRRLIAYTTAAGLGAFFSGQNADAQVTASAALAPYPATLPSDSGTNTADFAFDVDGDGTNDLQFIIFGQGNIPVHSQVADIIGLTNSVGTANQLLNDSATQYMHAWLGGETINASTGFAPKYKPRLALVYAYGYLLNNKFPTIAALGFSFVSSVDGQTHFGYMDVRVNATTNDLGQHFISSVSVKDIYYNATPNAGITIPVLVAVTNITVGDGNAVAINFSSNDNAPESAFTLETSPVLGPSANWTTDTNAVITLVTAANPNGAKPLAYYQAVTTGTGAASQFFRIKH